MGITEFLIEYIVAFISWGGYGTVFFLMVLESMVFPVPSEAVLPFVGFLIASGDFSFLWSMVAATLGSLVGSLLSYYLGAYGGPYALKRWGRYLLLNQEHLARTEKFFSQRGEKAIFICRFIPVVRHLISIPAGIGKMNLGRFLLFTVLGAGLWNVFLTYIGLLLGENWTRLESYTAWFDVVILVALFFLLAYFLYQNKKKFKLNKKQV